MQFICGISFGKYHVCLWVHLSLVSQTQQLQKKQEMIEEEKLSDRHCNLKVWTYIPSHNQRDSDLAVQIPLQTIKTVLVPLWNEFGKTKKGENKEHSALGDNTKTGMYMYLE